MTRRAGIVFGAALLLLSVACRADEYSDTVTMFKNAGAAAFFDKSYGYAVFPSIGKGGLVVGGAHGDGRVYRQGKYVGDASMTQVSVGLQAGGEAYRQIIFFENQAAFDQFTSGNFTFGAGVSATVLKTSAGASASTGGASAGAASGGAATNAASFVNGVAVFTIVKGGAMGELSVAGQKFKFKPKGS
jgi:lipid-binding SYLF domain-containing protein